MYASLNIIVFIVQFIFVLQLFYSNFCLIENLIDMIERDGEVEVGTIVILAAIDTEVIYFNKLHTNDVTI